MMRTTTPRYTLIERLTSAMYSAVALLIFIGILALISGCSAFAPHYGQVKALAETGVTAAIEDRQDVNDLKATTISALLGEISHGAYLRNFNPDEQAAIDTLILGAAKPPLTVDRLARAMALLDALGVTAPNPASPITGNSQVTPQGVQQSP